MEDHKKKYSINLSFEEVKLPPFEDILILGNKCPQGKYGIIKCFNLLLTEEIEFIDINDEIIEGIIINKRILKKMPQEKVIEILKNNVFPYVSAGEIVKVDFKLKISFDTFEGE